MSTRSSAGKRALIKIWTSPLKKSMFRGSAFLEQRGYKEIKLEQARPWNFVLGDERGSEVDFHVMAMGNPAFMRLSLDTHIWLWHRSSRTD